MTAMATATSSAAAAGRVAEGLSGDPEHRRGGPAAVSEATTEEPVRLVVLENLQPFPGHSGRSADCASGSAGRASP